MGECSLVRERMPELLTEVLAPGEREASHQHIEQCASCTAEWQATREVWAQMGDVPEVPVPAALRERFLAEIQPRGAEIERGRILRFAPRQAPRWLAQAAAAVILVGGAYFLGRNTGQPRFISEPVRVVDVAPFSLSERAVIPASQVNPDIQGRPQIENVRFEPSAGSEVQVSFDMTSHVTITGNRDDKSLVNLLSYVLQNREYPTHSRSNAIQWVRETYSTQGNADPEIVKALANVLKNDTHEGVRIKAVEALVSLPASLAPDARNALVDALRNDPNPAVRMKAVQALANLAAIDSKSLDLNTVDALREKAGQEDENPYVRVKAAEALSQIKL